MNYAGNQFQKQQTKAEDAKEVRSKNKNAKQRERQRGKTDKDPRGAKESQKKRKGPEEKGWGVEGNMGHTRVGSHEAISS